MVRSLSSFMIRKLAGARTSTPTIAPRESLASRITMAVGQVMALTLLVGYAAAQDFSASFSVASNVAGGSMIQSVGDTTNSLVNLFMGPGMFVIMALGAVLALYGYFKKEKEWLITGAIGFVLAAVLRGIWAFL